MHHMIVWIPVASLPSNPDIAPEPPCGDLTQNGSRDEWVDVADYRRGVGVLTGTIALWWRLS